MHDRVDRAARAVHLADRVFQLVPDGGSVYRVLHDGEDLGWFAIEGPDRDGRYTVTSQEDRVRKNAEGEVVRAVAVAWIRAFSPGEDPRPSARAA